MLRPREYLYGNIYYFNKLNKKNLKFKKNLLGDLFSRIFRIYRMIENKKKRMIGVNKEANLEIMNARNVSLKEI